MKILKHIVIGVLLFTITFSLMFFLSDKTEYHVVDNYVKERRVYVTDHGECYHTSGCHYLSQSRNAKGLYYARSRGYRACSYCEGTPYGTIEVNYYKTEIEDVTGAVSIKSIIFALVIVIIYMSVCVIIHLCKNCTLLYLK